MKWLLEDPTFIWATGLTALAVLAVMLTRTGRAVILAWMGGAAALLALMLLVEWLVVTEREEVEDTIHRMARALENNDLATLDAHVDPQAGLTRNDVALAMSRYEFSDASINDLDVRMNRLVAPPMATADFMGRVSLHDRQGHVPQGTLIRRFSVKFSRRDDVWRMVSYEHAAPVAPK